MGYMYVCTSICFQLEFNKSIIYYEINKAYQRKPYKQHTDRSFNEAYRNCIQIDLFVRSM